jgi:hypothetical protein
VADDVAFSLGLLRVEDLWERSGARSDGLYVEPSEAAWELVEEAVLPFLGNPARRAKRGKEAAAICQGILLGLRRAAQEEGEFLEGWAPDALKGAARLAVEPGRRAESKAPRGRRPEGERAGAPPAATASGLRCASSCRSLSPSGAHS